MGVFGSKGGLQDHGPVKTGAQLRLQWVATRDPLRPTKVRTSLARNQDSPEGKQPEAKSNDAAPNSSVKTTE